MARIDGMNLAGPSANPASSAQGAHGTGSAAENDAAAKARGRQDVLNVSNRGRVVAEAAAAVQRSTEVRTDRVAALKAAIAEGSYTSNAREIAARLLADGIAGGAG